MDQSIEILKWINCTDYPFKTENELKIYSICVSKWIEGGCRNLNEVERIHLLIPDHLKGIFIKTALINAYGKFGCIQNAKSVFGSIDDEDKDVVVIGAMMKALLNNGHHKEVTTIYEKYDSLQNDVLHMIAIQACIQMNDFKKGQRIFDTVISNYSFASLDIKLRSTLIDFYFHFGHTQKANILFNSIQDKEVNIVCINVMMKGLVNNEHNKEALKLYDRYLTDKPLNDVTHLFAIKACINTNNLKKGKNIHQKTRHQTVELKTTLIAFFGHFGDVKSAENIFDSIKNDHKTIFTLTEMMHIYCQCEKYQECIDIFDNIHTINPKLVPDVMCYANILYAHTASTSYHLGLQIHEELQKPNNAKILKDPIIQASLINFYGKCGKIRQCEKLFEDVADENKDTAICNAMLNSFARNGNANMSKQIFYEYFKEEKYKKCIADRNTFIHLMNAFNHCGDKENAMSIWQNEISDAKVKYDSYLVTTLIDCLSRRGDLNGAYELIQEYEENKLREHANDKYMWMSLLNGCKKHGDNKLAALVYNQLKNKKV